MYHAIRKEARERRWGGALAGRGWSERIVRGPDAWRMRRGYNEAREVTSRKIAVPEPAGAPRQDWQSPPESGIPETSPIFCMTIPGSA